MISKVLIANRGEIAVRIARACAAYGVTSVAVYSDPDADAPHVLSADEAYALPGSRPAETYLDIDAILDVARRARADAVHPGYGFLAENAGFAQAVLEAGMIWIGPEPETIRLLGDKVRARQLAAAVGVPLVQGSPGPVADGQAALAFAQEHGLPIAIKAAFGGGGRGLRVAWRLDEVIDQFESAVRESIVAFGRGECFVERYLHHPRHIEAQVIADPQGEVVVLGTRDCSLQRRNQKVVEEAPAPFLTEEQRSSIEQGAQLLCEAAGYVGAGTVEFLVGADGVVSFLEVNTRLQVEHPVTEMTTGVDIVRQQLRIADGLPLERTSPAPGGHALEFRVNAEDAGRGFLPSPGTITRFDPPGGNGVRVDSGVGAGSVIGGSYDSMVAKLVVWGRDRDEALRKARQAVREFRVEGVPTLLDFDARVLNDPAFAGGAEDFAVHTRWIETECGWLDELARPLAAYPGIFLEADASGGAAELLDTWIEIDGRRMQLRVPAGFGRRLAESYGSSLGAGQSGAIPGDPLPAPAGRVAGPTPAVDGTPVSAPITGTIVTWMLEDGCHAHEGQVLAVMEAMKMETSIVAPHAGTLHVLAAADGTPVTAGTVLATVG